MIDDLDEVLRQLLIRELPIRNNEVDITFDQPKREWSARLSRPTINFFLFEMVENKQLRQQDWESERNPNGKAELRRKPVRVDLHYLITAWATEPEDEHRLLTRALLALLRYRNLPEDLLPESLQDQPVPIPLVVAQKENMQNVIDLWSVMDNEMRPVIPCILTLSLNPYTPITAPVVRTRQVRTGQTAESYRPELDAQAGLLQSWSVGGQVRSQRPLAGLRLTLVERGQNVPLHADGSYVVGNLQAGEYTLEISGEGRPTVRHRLNVPAPDYDLEV